MTGTSEKLSNAVEAYFGELGKIRASGGGTDELSYYPALEKLLRTVGGSLKPRVFPVSNLSNQGAGLVEYRARVLSHRTALAEPKDLAWLLASYARDGLARVEAAGDAPALSAVRRGF